MDSGTRTREGQLLGAWLGEGRGPTNLEGGTRYLGGGVHSGSYGLRVLEDAGFGGPGLMRRRVRHREGPASGGAAPGRTGSGYWTAARGHRRLPGLECSGSRDVPGK